VSESKIKVISDVGNHGAPSLALDVQTSHVLALLNFQGYATRGEKKRKKKSTVKLEGKRLKIAPRWAGPCRIK